SEPPSFSPPENRLLPTELRHEALALQKELEFDFDAPGDAENSQDDEYKWAGLEPPKVMVTTSRDPSARLRLFAKELCLLFPGARRMNRGRAELGALVGACRAAGVTDLLVLHETRGRPGQECEGDAADVEWRWHPYTATAPKRRLLSAT
ncbi:U3 small nucleolar ribonucleoprotein protein IMP4, partial [Malurus melanocephalus]|uniref:U3 small nucleolar ribonucleoprotein protein IMP4 n=1 Tax=Malurus melanocephalus TaxID=175006 RepID=UPI002547FA9F